MFIYLDESGDLGFNFENLGTSKFFVITILVCKNTEARDLINRAVRRTLKNYVSRKKDIHNELKGCKTSLQVKRYFYKQIQKCENFEIHAIIFDKIEYLRQTDKKIDGDNLYNILSAQVIEQVNISRTSKVVLIVDRSKTRKKIAIFDKLLKSENGNFNISHEKSHNVLCLQAVDLFCWGIFKHLEHEDSEWYVHFKDKLCTKVIYKNKKDGP